MNIAINRCRQIRPANNWNDNNYLGVYPASQTIKHRPVDLDAHAKLLQKIGGLTADKR